MKNNYIFSLLGFVLFLVLSCFMFEATRTFLDKLDSNSAKVWILFLGAALPLIFYTFIADLDGIYEKMQHFFFRQATIQLLLPSILILFMIAYFVIPKLLRASFNKDIFVCLGGISFVIHLIFAARQSREPGFTGFVSYLLIFGLLYISTLFMLSVYLKIGFNMHLGSLILDSAKSGFSLVKGTVTQLLPR